MILPRFASSSKKKGDEQAEASSEEVSGIEDQILVQLTENDERYQVPKDETQDKTDRSMHPFHISKAVFQ